MQLKSWFNIEGSSSNPITGIGVIAQFYFPTNSSELDAEDRRVLAQCANHLRTVLQRRRVELAIIGHADHRGDTSYNKALGARRAKSVANELNRMLRSEQNFSSFSALSQGERYAARGARDQQAMALDRRVDVWSTTAKGYSVQELPKLDIQPGVLRPVVRVFQEIDSESNWDPESKDPKGEAMVEWLNLFIESVKGGQDVVPVRETKPLRVFKEVDATHRVNRVEIHTHNEFERETSHLGLQVRNTFSSVVTVTYHWGIPQPTVTVVIREDIDSTGEPRQTKQSVKHIDRQKADNDPFYFPTPRSL